MSRGTRSPPPKKRGPSMPARPRTRGDILERIERYEYVEGYGAAVRRARESMGLTREELAAHVQEKSTVIKKIENEELRPSLQLARKLEKALRITILREVSEEEEAIFKPQPATKQERPSLGDFLVREGRDE